MLAEPVCGDGDGGLDGHVAILSCVLRTGSLSQFDDQATGKNGAQARWVDGVTCVGAVAPAGGDITGSCLKTLTERSLATDTTKSLHPPR